MAIGNLGSERWLEEALSNDIPYLAPPQLSLVFLNVEAKHKQLPRNYSLDWETKDQETRGLRNKSIRSVLLSAVKSPLSII